MVALAAAHDSRHDAAHRLPWCAHLLPGRASGGLQPRTARASRGGAGRGTVRVVRRNGGVRRPMERMLSRNNAGPIVVYGATGHTGRFIVAELLRRGHVPVLCGRDVVQLAAMARLHPGLVCHVATVDDDVALDAALRGAAAVINAAGPFLDTA